MKRINLIIDPKLQNHKVAHQDKEVMSIRLNLRKRESKSIDKEMMIIARKLQVVEAVDEEEVSEMTIMTRQMMMTIIIRQKSLTCRKLGEITPTMKRVEVKEVVVKVEDLEVSLVEVVAVSEVQYVDVGIREAEIMVRRIRR